jgi:hypothetical protein
VTGLFAALALAGVVVFTAALLRIDAYFRRRRIERRRRRRRGLLELL